jgi:hypothetical protein
MSTVTPELRTPVMILVDASWENESGVVQTTRARMEDKSAGGACLRFKTSIQLGTRLRIQWRFGQFSGMVKYCRRDGLEYLIGIQRDTTQDAEARRQVPADLSQQLAAKADIPIVKGNANVPITESQSPGLRSIGRRSIEASVSTGTDDSPEKSETSKRSEVAGSPQRIEGTSVLRRAGSARVIPRRPYEIEGRNRLRSVKEQDLDAARLIKLRKEQPAKKKETGDERKSMGHKWFGLMPWQDKQADPDESGSDQHAVTSQKENPVPPVAQPTEKAPVRAREVSNFEVELMSMEDIYRAAGVASPRKGYSVNKVVEMLNSEHLRGLSKEMKRAAVLMALDAAGVVLDQVQRDAKARQSALDAYEAEQKKQAEVEWARKAEEILQIQSEMESIKAHYMSRINRNQEAVARDKARFSNWVATKQQEAQSMMEALELCSESQTSEPVSAPPAEISLAAGAGTGAIPGSTQLQ